VVNGFPLPEVGGVNFFVPVAGIVTIYLASRFIDTPIR